MRSYSDGTLTRTQTLVIIFLAMAWLSIVGILMVARTRTTRCSD
jgi:hypothetical protein